MTGFAELEKIISDGKMRFKAFENADAALSSIKGVLQLEKETNAAIEKNKRELAETESALVKQKDFLQAAKEEAKNIVSKADEKAAIIISNAEKSATLLIEDAEKEADKKASELKKYSEKVEDAKNILADYEAKAATAKAEYDGIMARFEALKK